MIVSAIEKLDFDYNLWYRDGCWIDVLNLVLYSRLQTCHRLILWRDMKLKFDSFEVENTEVIILSDSSVVGEIRNAAVCLEVFKHLDFMVWTFSNYIELIDFYLLFIPYNLLAFHSNSFSCKLQCREVNLELTKFSYWNRTYYIILLR